MIAYEDSAAAIDWLTGLSAFSERGGRYVRTDGTIGHAELELDGDVVMLATPSPTTRAPRGTVRLRGRRPLARQPLGGRRAARSGRRPRCSPRACRGRWRQRHPSPGGRSGGPLYTVEDLEGHRWMFGQRMSRGAYLMGLGLVPYGEAFELQRALAGAVSQGAIPETVVFLEHPPVVTIGRRTQDEQELHIPEDAKVEIAETDRGGKSTFHGPGQLVCYPILDLGHHGKDVKRYVRDLEEALIRTLAAFELEGVRYEGLTGCGCRQAAARDLARSRRSASTSRAGSPRTDMRSTSTSTPLRSPNGSRPAGSRTPSSRPWRGSSAGRHSGRRPSGGNRRSRRRLRPLVRGATDEEPGSGLSRSTPPSQRASRPRSCVCPCARVACSSSRCAAFTRCPRAAHACAVPFATTPCGNARRRRGSARARARARRLPPRRAAPRAPAPPGSQVGELLRERDWLVLGEARVRLARLHRLLARRLRRTLSAISLTG